MDLFRLSSLEGISPPHKLIEAPLAQISLYHFFPKFNLSSTSSLLGRVFLNEIWSVSVTLLYSCIACAALSLYFMRYDLLNYTLNHSYSNLSLLLIKTLPFNDKSLTDLSPSVLKLAAERGNAKVLYALTSTYDCSSYFEGTNPYHNSDTIEFIYTRLLWENEGDLAVHIAARKGHLNMLKYLSSQGFDLNASNAQGKVPLHEAALYGHQNLVKWLLTQEAVSHHPTDNLNRTPMHDAALNGHTSIVDLFLSLNTASTLHRDCDGRTALHEAAIGGHQSTLENLLRNNHVNINETENMWGTTALHEAVTHQHLELVNYLSQQREIQVNLRDCSGQTALHLAIRIGNPAIVECLLRQENIDTEIQNNYGATALGEAYLSNIPEIIELLQSN